MCVHMPTFVPFYEIIADICFPSGPAAIICNEIYEYSSQKESSTKF
jgi:hypothetical protein